MDLTEFIALHERRKRDEALERRLAAVEAKLGIVAPALDEGAHEPDTLGLVGEALERASKSVDVATAPVEAGMVKAQGAGVVKRRKRKTAK